MMGNQELSKSRYDSLLSGEGALKALFKVVKSASAGRGLDKVFISGTSPVILPVVTTLLRTFIYYMNLMIYADLERRKLPMSWHK